MRRFRAQLKLLLALLISLLAVPVPAAVSQLPLFLTHSADPRVMLVMSNDHQLSIKAYTDYSDLDGDGLLDTSYADSIEYGGYFDSDKCYSYSSGNRRFEPAVAVDSNTHQCTTTTTHWSGNLLNWASMTRMDMVRKVLYGGMRSTDTPEATVLERAFLPSDVHAFSKLFESADMDKYTPYNDASITLCNLTAASGGLSRDSTDAPLIRVGVGAFQNWAAHEVTQCQWGEGGPALTDTGSRDFVARVQVCTAALAEPECKAYGSRLKPAGLLQNYGEHTNSRPIRFGLMTGSYQKNKSGGVLRRNLERLTGHTGIDAIKNEIDIGTGQFINQGTANDGIINTLNRFRISQYDFTARRYAVCRSAGFSPFIEGDCVDWGNPLSEIYLESLRYLAGKTTPTGAFNADDSGYIKGLTQVDWVDPMASHEYCADTSVLVLTTGLNSFDTDQLTGHGIDQLDARVATNSVGFLENISSTTKTLIGSISGVASVDNKVCSAKPLGLLNDAQGVCPEVPTMEGGTM